MSLRERGFTVPVILILTIGVGLAVLGWSRESVLQMNLGVMTGGFALVWRAGVRVERKLGDLQRRVDRLASEFHRAGILPDRTSQD